MASSISAPHVVALYSIQSPRRRPRRLCRPCSPDGPRHQLTPYAELILCSRPVERVASYRQHTPPPLCPRLLRPSLVPALRLPSSTPRLASFPRWRSSFPRPSAAMAAFVQSAALTRTLGASASVWGSPVVCTKRVAPAVAAPVSTTIEAAKHAQFKAAKKANRCRPKKHRLSDINRKPPSYNVEPLRVEGYVLCPTACRCTVLRAHYLRSVRFCGCVCPRSCVCAPAPVCVWPSLSCRSVHVIRVAYSLLPLFVATCGASVLTWWLFCCLCVCCHDCGGLFLWAAFFVPCAGCRQTGPLFSKPWMSFGLASLSCLSRLMIGCGRGPWCPGADSSDEECGLASLFLYEVLLTSSLPCRAGNISPWTSGSVFCSAVLCCTLCSRPPMVLEARGLRQIWALANDVERAVLWQSAQSHSALRGLRQAFTSLMAGSRARTSAMHQRGCVVSILRRDHPTPVTHPLPQSPLCLSTPSLIVSIRLQADCRASPPWCAFPLFSPPRSAQWP